MRYVIKEILVCVYACECACACVWGGAGIYLATGLLRGKKQDRQCTCDKSLRCDRSTIVAVVKQQVLHILNVCMCNLGYPSCTAICDLSNSTVLFHIISYRGQFSGEKKFNEHKMRVLIYATHFVPKLSHSEKDRARYHKCTKLFM